MNYIIHDITFLYIPVAVLVVHTIYFYLFFQLK